MHTKAQLAETLLSSLVPVNMADMESAVKVPLASWYDPSSYDNPQLFSSRTRVLSCGFGLISDSFNSLLQISCIAQHVNTSCTAECSMESYSHCGRVLSRWTINSASISYSTSLIFHDLYTLTLHELLWTWCSISEDRVHAYLNLPLLLFQLQQLSDRLVREEHYALAVYVAKRWGLNDKPVWEEWALQLIR